mgnify:CR=1 FL=1
MPSWGINGYTIESLGIADISFNWSNGAVGTATLRTVDSGSPLALWAQDAPCTIYKDGAVFFYGWVAETEPASLRRDEGVTVKLENAMRWLQRTIFTRSFIDFYKVKTSTGGSLFIDALGKPVGIVQQMREILTCAVNQSGGKLNFSLNPTISDLQPPPEWVGAETCLEAVRKVMRWAPENVLYCDDSRGLRTVRWEAPGRSRSLYVTRGYDPVTDISASPTSAMSCAGVVIRFEAGHGATSYVADWVGEFAYPANVLPTTPGVLLITLPLDKYTTMAATWARQVYDAIKTFAWQGQMMSDGDYMGAMPGDLLYLTGRPEWLGSKCLIQQVSFSAATQTQTVNFGPAKHLGVNDLADAFWFGRSGGGTTDQTETTRGSFECYTDNLALYGLVLRIAPGTISDAKTEIVPKWIAGNNPGPLDASHFPFDRLNRTNMEITYYLHVLWLPDVELFTGTDALGAQVKTYLPLSTGTFQLAEILNYRADNRAPVVSTSGTVTAGEFYFRLATVLKTGDAISITSHKTGDMKLNFVPPNNLYIIANG